MDPKSFHTGILPDGTRIPHGEGIRGATSRRRLPNRRETVTQCVPIAMRKGAPESDYLISIGPVPGPIREIFAKGPKGDAGMMVDDFLIVVSVMLQSGYRVADILNYVERDDDGQPLSVLGKILAAAREMEKGVEG